MSKRLLQEGHRVTTIDNFSTGFPENIPEKVNLIQGNVQDPSMIQNLDGKNFEAIFHIAGQSSGEVSFDNSTYDLQTNTQSTIMLLDYAKKTGCSKFIYASSMSVYGDLSEEPVSESYPIFPQTFYAIGKLASEHYLRLYSKFGIQTTALRLFNVYGRIKTCKT